MLDSSVVSKASDSTGFSMDSMFGSVVNRADVVDLLMPVTPLISCLSFVGI